MRAILEAAGRPQWNGGIGTYVKAVDGATPQSADKANDALRVDGPRAAACLVSGGRQPRARPQLRPDRVLPWRGRLNTDAIDNSAGVDCSDHEVNIKDPARPGGQDG
jgi:glutamate dehydrogenase